MSSRARQAYERVAPYLVLLIGLTAALGIWVGVGATITNGRQDAQNAAENKARDEYNRKLLHCFDEFATDLSGGLPPVRAATAENGAALSEAMGTLEAGLVKVKAGTFTNDDLEQIIADFGKYQAANRNLVQVRKENPYPEPPSTFCATH